MFCCSIIDINECETANGGCEQLCSNIIGSFVCSCGVGYWLNENGLNCSGECIKLLLTYYRVISASFLFHADIDECESPDLNNCHANAQCTNTKGSFSCFCNPGYTGDGINCTSKIWYYHLHLFSFC